MKEERTSIIKKNIYYSLLIKGLSTIVSYLMFSITYQFLGSKDLYGVWLTILSVLTWITLLDLGIGNGLRNQLANKVSLELYEEGKALVSTTYTIMSIIIFSLLCLYFVIRNFIDWGTIFNFKDSQSLNIAMTIIFTSYMLNFIVGLINSIAYAHQHATYPSLINLLTNSFIVILILMLKTVGISSIEVLALVFGISNLLVLLLANIILFKKSYYKIKPALSCINFSQSRSLVNLGVKFFVIQIMSVVIFTTDNLIITHALGPSYVSEYQVVYKLFSVFTIISSIVMTPLWSAYTDAYAKKDYNWIKKTLKKLIFLMIPFLIGIILLIIARNKIIFLWMGDQFIPSNSLAILVGIYILVSIWSSIFAYLLNGINKTNFQMIAVVIGGVVNIPLSLFFVSLGLGLQGVVLGTICALSLFAITGPLEVYYRIHKLQ